MGILDGIVEWIAEQVMNILDLITTSVLGALGCSMDTFLRYFPAAESLYQVFLALAIGLILLNWIWQLFKNYFLGAGIEAEDPIKLSMRVFIFLFLAFYAKDIVDLLLGIAGTPYSWILTEDLPPLKFGDFNSVVTVILGVCANGAVAIIALLIIPVLFIVMLPGLIFGSLTENTGALNSNTLINENIRTANQAIVEVLEESHEDILSEINTAIAKLPEGDTTSINDPYAYSISVNANQLISQFCASRDNYEDINVSELKRVIRANKDGLFTFDVSKETVTMEVTVGGGAEGEAGDETETQTKTITFTRHTYSVKYAGDTYFADHVFHLTDDQKKIADAYAENLTSFFGSAASGVATANVSDEVLRYRAAVQRIAASYW